MGLRARGENGISGTNNASPSPVLNPTAARALSRSATAPTTTPPTAAIPMHWPSTPSADPRISPVADIMTIVLCMVLNPAAPTPEKSNRRNESGYQGERANNSKLENWRSKPKQNIRP